jgi:hypothetical protein
VAIVLEWTSRSAPEGGIRLGGWNSVLKAEAGLRHVVADIYSLTWADIRPYYKGTSATYCSLSVDSNTETLEDYLRLYVFWPAPRAPRSGLGPPPEEIVNAPNSELVMCMPLEDINVGLDWLSEHP